MALPRAVTRAVTRQGGTPLETKCIFDTDHDGTRSDDFKQTGGALAAADAHRDRDILGFAALALDERMSGQP